MSQLSDFQLTVFTAQFLIMAFVAEIGQTLTGSHAWTALSGLALLGAAYSLLKVVRRNWGTPA